MEDIERKDIPDYYRRILKFDILRIKDLKFDITKIKTILESELLAYPLQKKDKLQTYSAVGLQYHDESDPIYDAVRLLKVTDNEGRSVQRQNATGLTQEAFKKPNAIGSKLMDVISCIDDLGFNLSRGRLLVTHPGHINVAHYDNDVRLHIPIVTNPYCLTFFDDERPYFLKADGHAYLFNAYKLHHFANFSAVDRWHLVFILNKNLLNLEILKNVQQT